MIFSYLSADFALWKFLHFWFRIFVFCELSLHAIDTFGMSWINLHFYVYSISIQEASIRNLRMSEKVSCSQNPNLWTIMQAIEFQPSIAFPTMHSPMPPDRHPEYRTYKAEEQACTVTPIADRFHATEKDCRTITLVRPLCRHLLFLPSGKSIFTPSTHHQYWTAFHFREPALELLSMPAQRVPLTWLAR